MPQFLQTTALLVTGICFFSAAADRCMFFVYYVRDDLRAHVVFEGIGLWQSLHLPLSMQPVYCRHYRCDHIVESVSLIRQVRQPRKRK